MVLAFQIVLFGIIILGFMGVVGEQGNKDRQMMLTGITIAGILALTVTFLFL